MTRLVFVRWTDARGISEHWHHPDEADEGVCVCASVGWIVREDDAHVAVAPHRTLEDDDADQQVCGVMYIPRHAIVQVVEIPEPEAACASPTP